MRVISLPIVDSLNENNSDGGGAFVYFLEAPDISRALSSFSLDKKR